MPRGGFFLIAALLLAPGSKAMTVIPPTFAELVAESSTIVRGTVKEIRSEKVPGARGALIKTFVTFRVSSALKGAQLNQEVTLSFLGGTVDDERMEIPGMPSFEVGREDYLFVSPKKGICPLVGAMHGRYRLITPQKDNRPYVAREDHTPLVRISDVVLPMRSNSDAAGLNAAPDAITPAEFEKSVLNEIARSSTSRARP
jgi:hypothetical protein